MNFKGNYKIKKWWINLFLIIFILFLTLKQPKKDLPIAFSFLEGYSRVGEREALFNVFYFLLFLNLLNFILYIFIPEKRAILFLVPLYLNLITAFYFLIIFLANLI